MSQAGRGGLGDDAIVHVGEVHHLRDLEAARAQEAAQDVLEDEGAEVADVGVVVDRGAAGVDGHSARMQGHERLLLPRHGILKYDFAHCCPGTLRLCPCTPCFLL